MHITATPSEFAAIAERIFELAHEVAGKIVFPASSSRVSSALVVQIAVGPVNVTFDGDALLVFGSPEAISLFGQNLPCELALPAGYHIHFEHNGREEAVAPESIPLVMIVA